MKNALKISLQKAWLDGFFEFFHDYIRSCTQKQFYCEDLVFAAYRGWKNTMFGVDDCEPSIQVKEFFKIIDAMCLPYLNGAYVMFKMRLLGIDAIESFAKMMIDKINEPCFNVNDAIPKR